MARIIAFRLVNAFFAIYVKETDKKKNDISTQKCSLQLLLTTEKNKRFKCPIFGE